MKQLPDPQSHILTQKNVSDVIGDLFATKNIDMTENMGRIRVGQRLIVNTNSNDSGNFTGTPVAFVEYNSGAGDHIYYLAGSSVVETTDVYPASPSYSYTNVGTTFSSDTGDMIIYNGNMYATSQTALNEFVTGAWTGVGGALGTGTPHMMCTYNGLLYVTDLLSQVKSWDGSTFNASLLQLGNSNENIITCIRASSNRIWICTINQDGGRGNVYEWDGAATTVTKTHILESAGALSCVIKDDIPYIMDVYGRMLAWNGSTFIEQGRLNRRSDALLYNCVSNINNRFIHPNGMAIIRNRINVLVDGRHNDSTGSIEIPIPAGVYEFDDQIGLYHKYSFGMSHAADTITDYGAARISRAGGLQELNYPSVSTSRNGTFMAGADYYTTATTVISGSFYNDSNDTLQKAGYLITTKIEAMDGTAYSFPTLEAMWQSFYTVYRNLLNTTDRIIPKYRITDVSSAEGTVSWVDSYTFKVPNSSVGVSNFIVGGNGGEVEILQGLGAGQCVHIKTATLGGDGNWLVTIDDPVTGATGQSQARFQNWIKISEISSTNNNVSFNSDMINVKSTWIQFKVYMLFTGKDEIERFIISNANGNPAS